MKNLISKLPLILLAAGGFLATLSSTAKADVLVIREGCYEQSHCYSDRAVRYEGHYEGRCGQFGYREPVYRSEGANFRSGSYRDCPQPSSYYQNCSPTCYYTR